VTRNHRTNATRHNWRFPWGAPFILVALILNLVAISFGQISPAAELAATWRRPCIVELKALTQEMNRMDGYLKIKLLQSSHGPMTDVLQTAWGQRSRAWTLYQSLMETPHKYNKWSSSSRLPGFFQIPMESVQVKRWEALRPLIAPALEGNKRLGWDEPQEDEKNWQSPLCRTYELFLLFHWFIPQKTEIPFDKGWIQKEVGADLLSTWQNSIEQRKGFLHNEYVYETIKFPQSQGLPSRIQAILPVICWTRKNGTPSDLLNFMQQKDQFMLDLLELLCLWSGDNSIAVEWFSCCARCFPPFTLMQPELNAAKNKMQVMKDRPSSIAHDKISFLESHCSRIEIVKTIKESCYAYQMEEVIPKGDWKAPIAGWSGWTFTGKSERETSPNPDINDSGKKKEQKAPEEDGSYMIGPDKAWRTVCLWAQAQIKELENPSAEKSSHFFISVENLSDWRLAFGEYELREILQEIQGLKPQIWSSQNPESIGNARHYIVQISSAESPLFLSTGKENGRIHVNLLAETKSIAHKTFEVTGPWPAWFASPKGLFRKSVIPSILLTMTGILGICAILILLLKRKLLPFRFWPEVVCIVLFVGIGILIFAFRYINGPCPQSFREIGGVVEFAVPANDSIPPDLRIFITQCCVNVYKQLASYAEGNQLSRSVGFWDRFYFSLLYMSKVGRKFISDEIKSQLIQNSTPENFSNFHMSELKYRIQPASWGADHVIHEGRIRSLDVGHFQKNIVNLTYKGEPDIPMTLKIGPSPDTTFVFALTDGDHGSLHPPLETHQVFPDPPILSVYLSNPSRDSVPSRRLDARSRFELVKKRSHLVLPMVENIEEDNQETDFLFDRGLNPSMMDKSSLTPQDMEVARNLLWNQDPKIKERCVQIAEKIGIRARKMFIEKRKPTSRTLLQITPEWDWFIGILIILIVGTTFWLLNFGVTSGGAHLLVLLRYFIIIVILCPILSFIYAWYENSLWTYNRCLISGTFQSFGFLSLAMFWAALLHINRLWERHEVNSIINRGINVKGYLMLGVFQIPGFLLLCLGGMCFFTAPVGNSQEAFFIPSCYVSSLMLGLGLWVWGIFILLIGFWIHRILLYKRKGE
jgi:hypothetical protein